MRNPNNPLFECGGPDPRPGAEPAARHCSDCGNPVKQDSAFCPRCGKRLASSPVDPLDDAQGQAGPQETMTPLQELIKATSKREAGSQPVVTKASGPVWCNCGQDLPGGANYCLKCGARVGQAATRYGLVYRSNEGPDQSIAIAGEEFSIGKAPDCDLVITDDEYVSRHHARISQADGMVFLEDLNSSNGTFLRPRRAIALEAGDEILIGASVFRLEEVAS